MTAMLTVASIDLEVLVAGASQAESVLVGSATRAWDGSMRSSIRARKRVWHFTALRVSQGDYNTLRSAIEAGAGIVNCTGDALDGATVACLVTPGAGDYLRDGLSFIRTLALTLEEA